MQSLLRPWFSAWRSSLLRAAGVMLGPDADVQGPVCIRHVFSHGQRGSIRIGRGAQIARGVVIESWGGAVAIGDHSFLGPYAVVYGHGGVIIGDACLISMHCRIVSSNHTVPPRGRRIQLEPDILRATKIGHDVWLGAGVTVLGGVTIGDGCVVGAGAVVTHDLPAYSIATGVPAKIVGHRP